MSIFDHFFTFSQRKPNSQIRKTAPIRGRRLTLESLESRELLSMNPLSLSPAVEVPW